LESVRFKSVFIPNGLYIVNQGINVTTVNHIVGESRSRVAVSFQSDGDYLLINSSSCYLENFGVIRGGDTSENRGSIYITSNLVTVENCLVSQSLEDAFEYNSNGDYVEFINCVVIFGAGIGFHGNSTVNTSSLTNCKAIGCVSSGFAECYNLSSCVVDGYNQTISGFLSCYNISASLAYDCATNGFSNSSMISACRVDGNSNTTYGFSACSYISSSYVSGADNTSINCGKYDSESTNLP
jgi:hypothetical protein